VNRGREFLVDVAPDGRVLSVSPTRVSEEPVAFASCVVARMQSLTFAPTATGEVVHIRVCFGIESP